MMSQPDYDDFPKGVTCNPTWTWHTYIPYANPDQGQLVPCSGSQPTPVADQIAAYGPLKSVDDFCLRAQLTNYMQYRALYEGFLSQMWECYAGVFVWKSQNPWTGLRGQLYDWYLDQTGGFYGAKHACEMVHIQLNVDTSQICVVNHSAAPLTNVVARVAIYNLNGVVLYTQSQSFNVAASAVSIGNSVKWPNNLPPVYFVKLQLRDAQQRLLSDNFYWESAQAQADYSDLKNLPWLTPATKVQIKQAGDEYVLNASVANPATSNGVAFFIRLKLLKSGAPTGSDNRVLPSFYEDNYFSLLPGEQKSVTIRCAQTDTGSTEPELWIEAWNIHPVPIT